MNRDPLREMLTTWMLAERLVMRIQDCNRCGRAASESDTATLNEILDKILLLQDAPSATLLTDKGHDIIDTVAKLEAAKRENDRTRIIFWAGILVKATSTLVSEYLDEEAENIRMEGLGA